MSLAGRSYLYSGEFFQLIVIKLWFFVLGFDFILFILCAQKNQFTSTHTLFRLNCNEMSCIRNENIKLIGVFVESGNVINY